MWDNGEFTVDVSWEDAVDHEKIMGTFGDVVAHGEISGHMGIYDAYW